MGTTCTRVLRLTFLVVGTSVLGSDSFFHEHVVPILQRRCVGCHSDSERKGDFSAETAAGAFEAGFIEPGDVEGSRFIEVAV